MIPTKPTESSAPKAPAAKTLNKTALTMLVAALITVAGPIWYLASAVEDDAFLPFLILILPSVLIAFGAINLLLVDQQPPLLTAWIVRFEVAKNLLVVIYIFATKRLLSFGTLVAVSWVALCVGSILVFLVFRLTAWIMRYTVVGDSDLPRVDNEQPHAAQPDSAIGKRHGVIQQLLLHRFLSICGLLVVFLYLMIFLAFTVAFHDSAWSERLHADAPSGLSLMNTDVHSGVALKRVLGREGRLDLQYKSAASEAKATAVARSTAPRESELKTGADPVFLLTFRKGSASLQCSIALDRALTARLDSKFFDSDSSQAWRVAHLKEKGVVPQDCRNELEEIAWNVHELHILEARLKKLHEQNSFDRYRALVISHATKDEPRSAFASNYEISRARAEQTEEFIESLLLDQQRASPDVAPFNIEWLLLPASSGDAFLLPANSAEVGRFGQNLSRGLSVEIEFLQILGHLTALQRKALPPSEQLAETRNLTLLDYLYFIMTKADHGDLMPTTGFVEFIASIASIFELFFLVVAFNVILAFRREPIPSPQGSPLSEADAQEGGKPAPQRQPNTSSS